jgi:hypothetical protein
VRNDDFSGSGERSYKRKRQRADKILNILIGVVILLIVLVGGQFLLGDKSDTPVASDKLEENDTEEIDVDNENDTDEATEPSDSVNPDNEEEEPQLSEETVEPGDEPTSEEATGNEETSDEDLQADATLTDDGKWKPIGTVQPEPFSAVYSKEHINWAEMTRAFQYATGLGNDITLWRVGNGGNNESAVGVVSDNATRTTPYQVRIAWVTKAGGVPVNVDQLTANPYFSR